MLSSARAKPPALAVRYVTVNHLCRPVSVRRFTSALDAATYVRLLEARHPGWTFQVCCIVGDDV